MVVNEYLAELADHPLSPWGQGFDRHPDDGKRRDELVERYAWAIPSDEAIEAIAALSPIVEVGAGTGYWAYLLAKAGADVVAYDQKPEGRNVWFKEAIADPWFPVQQGTARSVEAHRDRTLFLCWPPYRGRMANDALRYYRGDRFAYVGEGQYGCTGGAAFHNRLDREWDVEAEVGIPQWAGINDSLTIYRRRTPFTRPRRGGKIDAAGGAAGEGTRP